MRLFKHTNVILHSLYDIDPACPIETRTKVFHKNIVKVVIRSDGLKVKKHKTPLERKSDLSVHTLFYVIFAFS